tara:strand:- start:98 stop:589 length:492 start_codon:yes stop_codon:yes gene_type:complete
MTTEKQELRVKINHETQVMLDAYCEQSGTTKGQVITDLIWGKIPERLAHAGVFLSKYLGISIYTQGDTIAKKNTSKGLHILPKDFAPDRTIASEAGIDYDGALQAFSDWAKSKGKKYKDWDACFRTACNSWLKERYPHLRRVSTTTTNHGLNFDITTKHPEEE